MTWSPRWVPSRRHPTTGTWSSARPSPTCSADSMTASPTGPLLRAVDRAAFVVAFGERLRRAGVPVTFTALGTCTDALEVAPPGGVADLYWLGRVSLVKHAHDLTTFDAVFDVVFRDAVLAVHGQAAGPRAAPATAIPAAALAGDPSVESPEDGQGLPWHTLPHDLRAEQGPADGVSVPELLPSAIEGLADVGFDELDEEQLVPRV